MSKLNNLAKIQDQKNLQQAWESFIETGKLQQHAPRQIITESWVRCKKSGINPYFERADSVMSQDELDHYLSCEALGIAGKSVLEKMVGLTDDSKHVMVLANARGQILHTIGDKSVYPGLEKINFMPGSNWSISHVGPNGIGTPIALDRAELVFGQEHFCKAWKNWVCYGAPIHDRAGNVLGVVDITGPAENLRPETLSVAISMAHSVESSLELLACKWRDRLRAIYNEKKFTYANDHCLLMDENGIIEDIDPKYLQVFRWAGHRVCQKPMSSVNTKLWLLIQKCMQNGLTKEYEYHNQNAFQGVKLLIEPIMEGSRCLGCMLILKHTCQIIKLEEAETIIDDTDSSANLQDLKSFSDDLIRDTLDKNNGNISQTARVLGINRTTIYRRLKLLNATSH